MKLITRLFNVVVFIACVMGAALLSNHVNDDLVVLKKTTQVLLGISAVWIVITNILRNKTNN